jgi:uncharacterized protein (TIGR02597 family)
MNQTKLHGLMTVTVAFLTAPLQAEPISDAVGYNALSVPADSDALVSVPYNQIVEFTGTVSSVTGGNTLNVAGTPFTAGEFSNGLFFVRMSSGAKNGLWSTITNNTTSSVNLSDATLAAGVVAMDTFAIYPHQTLGEVFPANLLGTAFFASPNAGARKTEVLARNQTSVGINKSSVGTYFYLSSGTNFGWRLFGQPITTDFGNAILPPDTHVILRNNTNIVLTCVAQGTVDFGTLGRSLATYTNSQNDVYAVSGRPVPVSLNELGFGGTPAFRASPNAGNRVDQLFTYNNQALGKNKSSVGTYFYLSSGTNVGWRLFGQPITTDYGPSNVIQAAEGFVIRRGTNSVNASADWQAAAPYPASNQ